LNQYIYVANDWSWRVSEASINLSLTTDTLMVKILRHQSFTSLGKMNLKIDSLMFMSVDHLRFSQYGGETDVKPSFIHFIHYNIECND